MNHHGVISSDRQMMVLTQNNESGGYELSVLVKQDPAVTYTSADMAGTWYTLELVSGDFSAVPSQWTGWIHGMLTIDGAGAYTVTDIVVPSGPQPDKSGTFSITTSGVLSDGGNRFHGFMNAAKNLVVFTEDHDGNGYGMGIAIKRDPAAMGTFSRQDLLGTWYNHSLVAGDAPASTPAWYYSTHRFNADGTEDYYEIDAGGGTDVGSEPFNPAMDDNGILSEPVDQLHGVLSDDGKLLIVTQTIAASGEQNLSILSKKSDDTEPDGMEDGWEWAYFGNLDHDGTADTDGDGLSDLDEFVMRKRPDECGY